MKFLLKTPEICTRKPLDPETAAQALLVNKKFQNAVSNKKMSIFFLNLLATGGIAHLSCLTINFHSKGQQNRKHWHTKKQANDCEVDRSNWICLGSKFLLLFGGVRPAQCEIRTGTGMQKEVGISKHVLVRYLSNEFIATNDLGLYFGILPLS